ncbi:branched chain amino acid ABC transporter substrate-binding protein [Frankia sp. CcI156]|nr:branched chain amino acid ABC transporter substrate-binding protein [Frankia sp. CgIS1]ONH28532.1 branched chain amino acid ABC transporter substrate-binding protein [Frankia sp. CcI156]ORT54429.1 branched chain amino acid ABC transporter substrate-binding protein [Frankia sp. KB5]
MGVLTAAAVLAGCGGGSSGDDGKKEYAIGFQGPLSGDNQQLGINAYDGVLTAVELANRRKDLPFRLRLVASDDQGMAEQGPTAAQKLIDNPEVIGVVGPVFSGPTKSSEPLYSGAGLLSVSPSATNPALTDLGFTSFYRVIAPDTVQGSAAAEYLAKVVKADKVYSLDDRSEYGTGLSGALEKALTGRGIRVIHDGINPTKDYTSQATKILAENPDAVYYSGYYAELALLTRALRSKGYTGKVVSGDGANDDQLIHQAGAGNAEGTLLTCPCGDPNSDPAAAGFVADYKTINADARPGTYSGEAYDATNAVIEVLRRLGSGATREAVLARFGSVDIPGVTKRIRFRKNGEVEGSTVYVYEVRAGKRAVLGPVSSLVRP